MSYVLTYSGPAVKAFHKTHAKARRYTHHVIRWGNNWGFIQQSPNWDTAWQAEQRAPVADHEHEAERFLLERITPQQVQAPPLAIDDMWSEEVIFDRHIKAGNVLYIRGTLLDIQETLKQLNILTPSFLHQEYPPSPMKEREQEPPQYQNSLLPSPPQPRQVHQPRQRFQQQPPQAQRQGPPSQPYSGNQRTTGGMTSHRPPQPSSQHRPARPSPSSRPPPSPAQSNRSTQSRSQGTQYQRNHSRQPVAQQGQTSQ